MHVMDVFNDSEEVRIGYISNINGEIIVDVFLPQRFSELTTERGYSSNNAYSDIVIALGASSVEPIYDTSHRKKETGIKLTFANTKKHLSPLQQVFLTRDGKSPATIIKNILDDHIALTDTLENKPNQPTTPSQVGPKSRHAKPA